MAPSIPNSHSVDVAFQRVVKRLGTVRKRINASAAKEMKADDYETAQKWMEMGRSVADFGERLEAFMAEWKRLVKATRIVARARGPKGNRRVTAKAKPKRTPVWKYYEPVVKALIARGGSASLAELMETVNRDFSSTLTELDFAATAGDTPRWQIALKQACRHCQGISPRRASIPSLSSS